MKQSTLLSLAVASVLAAGAAFAAPATAPAAKAHVRLDANGDGVIDRAEAAKAPKFAERFARLDRNGDGNISKSEATADKYMARAFSGLDEDHDGKLDREEAMRWLNN